MKEIVHNHVTHDEIERYMKADADYSLQSEWDFLNDFDSKLKDCGVCAKRLRAYSVFEIMLKEETPKSSITSLAEEVWEALKGKWEEIKLFVLDEDRLVFETSTRLVVARGMSAETNREATFVRPYNNFDQFKEVLQGFDFDHTEQIEIAFEINSIGLKMGIAIPQEKNQQWHEVDDEYKLRLWNITNGEAAIYPAKLHPEEMYFNVGELEKGVYMAVISRRGYDGL